MFDLARDVQSLSHFKRNTAAVMKRMKKNQVPVVLTVNGKARAVVLDPATYQKMTAEAAKAEMIQFLKESQADIDAGRVSRNGSYGRNCEGVRVPFPEKEVTRQVSVSVRAGRDIRQSFAWLLSERGRAYAEKWYVRIRVAMESLSENAEQWAEAAESEWYGPALREKLVGRKRQTYRVIFEIQNDVVYVQRIRHISQDYLSPTTSDMPIPPLTIPQLLIVRSRSARRSSHSPRVSRPSGPSARRNALARSVRDRPA